MKVLRVFIRTRNYMCSKSSIVNFEPMDAAWLMRYQKILSKCFFMTTAGSCIVPVAFGCDSEVQLIESLLRWNSAEKPRPFTKS